MNNGNGSDSGHTRIYQYSSNTNTWNKLGQDIDGEASYDNSGRTVSLSADGTIVAIGANFNDGIGNDAGHTRIYQFNKLESIRSRY